MKCPIKCILIAGIGGMMPTISRLAATYCVNPHEPLPETGLYFGLALFFFIGAVLAFAFSENKLKQAFILGVCAPGIITNIVAGVSGESIGDRASFLYKLENLSSAYGQTNSISTQNEDTSKQGPATNDNQFLKYNEMVFLTNVVGEGKWDTRKILIFLTAIEINGSRISLNNFSADKRRNEFIITANSSEIEVRVANISKIIQLPDEEYKKIVIESTIQVEGSNDFLWALGARRKPNIVNVDTRIVYIVGLKPIKTPSDQYWVQAKGGSIPNGAVIGGKEHSPGEEILYVCRTLFNGGLHPGKIRKEFGGCKIGWGGKEYTVAEYQVLIKDFEWVTAKEGKILDGAIQGGREHAPGKEALYVCRARFKNGLHPGKVRPWFKGCNIVWGGIEYMVPDYEILVKHPTSASTN